ncbi:hypothetical protein EI94DRAFT_1715550 [Lactarius quietus]|nr:hypothetical protein EI94DRAFT_1715550 [Lactarius quietus]
MGHRSVSSLVMKMFTFGRTNRVCREIDEVEEPPSRSGPSINSTAEGGASNGLPKQKCRLASRTCHGERIRLRQGACMCLTQRGG